MRIGACVFAGELGWEIHCANDAAPAIWDAITGAGAKPFGMWALNSLGSKKGTAHGRAICPLTTACLKADWTVSSNWTKRLISGKAAMLAEKQQGVAKRFVTLTVDAGACDAPYMSTLWQGDEVVGETTSGAWGYRVNASIALGMLRTDLAVPGPRLRLRFMDNATKPSSKKINHCGTQRTSVCAPNLRRSDWTSHFLTGLLAKN